MRDALARMRVMRTVERPPQLFVRGQGSWLGDAEGDAYLDFNQGGAVNSLGHSPSVLVSALRRQVENLINPGAGYYNLGMLKLATRLCHATDSDQAYFLSSGAEANEVAIRLARKWGQLHRGGAGRIVTAFNGSPDKASARPGSEAGAAGFTSVPFNDLGALAAALDEQTVAVMLAPLLGEAGAIPATLEYLQGVARLCRERGLLLILDELQTGIGRCGALLARGNACCFEPGDRIGSYHSNSLATGAGLAVLDAVLEPGFLEHVRAVGEHLSEGLAQLARRHGHGPLRGHGLLLGLPLVGLSAPAVVEAALKERLLIDAPQAHCLGFSPALTVSHGNIDEMLKRLTRALGRISGRN